MRESTFFKKAQRAISFYGWRNFLKIGVNAFVPNHSSIKVAITKSNYNDYFSLKRQFGKKVRIFEPKCNTDNRFEKYIWTLWLQGEENAPDIVKACWQSIKMNMPSDYELKILSKSSVNKYVQLPNYIEDKYSKNQISMAHYSDLLRLKLLIDYGGYWVDSTVYCTNSDLFHFIKRADLSLFVYKNIMRNDEWSALSSWLIYAKKDNIILRNVYELLLEYWRIHNTQINYFLFHIFFKIVTEKMKKEWDKTPTLSNVDPHLLSRVLFEPYDELYFQFLGKCTSFHKLTHKICIDDIKKNDTFYQHIVYSCQEV